MGGGQARAEYKQARAGEGPATKSQGGIMEKLKVLSVGDMAKFYADCNLTDGLAADGHQVDLETPDTGTAEV